MKNNQNAIRHGEIVIQPIGLLPLNLTVEFEGKEYVIGHSESGHHHVLVGRSAIFQTLSPGQNAHAYKQICCAVFGENESLWPGELVPFEMRTDGKIIHQKTFDLHEPLPVLRGLYIKYVKHQFNYFSKMLEQVRD